MSQWKDPEGWGRLLSGEDCPICRSIREEGAPLGTVAEMEVSCLTSQPSHPVRGYCCLVLKRHVVELHDLEDDEADGFMRDARRASRALQQATGAVKMNLEIHGNTIPHLHAHLFPRYVGDRFEGGPLDTRVTPIVREDDEFRRFARRLRAELSGG